MQQGSLTGTRDPDDCVFSIDQEGATLSYGGFIMLGWALTFLIVALIAAVLGFGGIAAGAASIAKILFFLFLVLFIVSLIFGMRRPAA